jgi:hypothetical protein
MRTTLVLALILLARAGTFAAETGSSRYEVAVPGIPPWRAEPRMNRLARNHVSYLCMHADPRLKDVAPGESATICGSLIFFEGKVQDFDYTRYASR